MNIAYVGRRIGICLCDKLGSGSRELSGDNLEKENSNGESVNLVGVEIREMKGLWWHVDHRSWTPGHLIAGHGGIGGYDLGHAKVGHLGLVAGIQEDVVAGQVSMEDAIPVKVSHC